MRSHPRLIRITHAQLWCGSCNADRGARNDERVLLTSKRPATDRRCSVAAVRIVKRNNSSRHKKGRFLFVLPSLPGFQPPVFFGARYVRAKGLARALFASCCRASPPAVGEGAGRCSGGGVSRRGEAGGAKKPTQDRRMPTRGIKPWGFWQGARFSLSSFSFGACPLSLRIPAAIMSSRLSALLLLGQGRRLRRDTRSHGTLFDTFLFSGPRRRKASSIEQHDPKDPPGWPSDMHHPPFQHQHKHDRRRCFPIIGFSPLGCCRRPPLRSTRSNPAFD